MTAAWVIAVSNESCLPTAAQPDTALIYHLIWTLTLIQWTVFIVGTAGNLLLARLLQRERLVFWRLLRLLAWVDTVTLALHTNDCWMHMCGHARGLPSTWYVYVAYVHTPLSMAQMACDSVRLCLTSFAVLNRLWCLIECRSRTSLSCRHLPWIAGASIGLLAAVSATRIALVCKAALTVDASGLRACRLRLFFQFTELGEQLNMTLMILLMVALPIAVWVTSNALLAVSVARRRGRFRPPGSSRIFNRLSGGAGVGLVRVLVPVTAVFAVCQLGRFFWELRRKHTDELVQLVLYFVGVVFLSVDCSVNFYIQIAVRRSSRDEARRLVRAALGLSGGQR